MFKKACRKIIQNVKKSKNKITRSFLGTRNERKKFIKSHVNISLAKILEVGAFNAPTYTKPDVNVQYMDWFSKEELYKNFKKKPERAKNIVDVDFVIKDKHFENHIPGKFDLLIANHVIEHIPDMISWLKSASAILSEKGLLFLSIPHKDYTFDKIRPLTTLGQIIENYENNINAPSLKHVFDSLYLYRPIRSNHVWDGNYKELLKKKRFTAKEALEKAHSELAKKCYVDVHCHVFDYKTFLEICEDLNSSNYTEFKTIASKDVIHSGNEFYVLLGK